MVAFVEMDVSRQHASVMMRDLVQQQKQHSLPPSPRSPRKQQQLARQQQARGSFKQKGQPQQKSAKLQQQLLKQQQRKQSRSSNSANWAWR